MPFFSTSASFHRSYRPPRTSEQRSSWSNVPSSWIALSRMTGHGMRSIHSPCTFSFCNLVLPSDVGTTGGAGNSGMVPMPRLHSIVIRWWRARMFRFVWMPRSTLYETRMIRRWSEERGAMNCPISTVSQYSSSLQLQPMSGCDGPLYKAGPSWIVLSAFALSLCCCCRSFRWR